MKTKISSFHHFSSLVTCVVFFIGCSPPYCIKKSPPETLKITHFYKNGKIQDEYYVLVDKDKNIVRDRNREEIRHGKYILWYENGNKKEEGEYLCGQETGLWTGWHKNGIKADEKMMKNGKREGISVYWNEKGEKTAEQTYKNGYSTKKPILYSDNKPLKQEYSEMSIESVFGTLYLGYPLIASTICGIDILLPSTRYQPIKICTLLEPGFSGFKAGIAIAKGDDARQISLQGNLHYSWYETNWKSFPHTPPGNAYAGGEIGLDGIGLSIKAGPYFLVHGNCSTDYYLSVELGINIRNIWQILTIGPG